MQDGLQLFELLDACAAHLLTDDFLDDLPIKTENEGDIETKINIELNKIGLVVVIANVAARNKLLNAPKPVWFPITFDIIVTERAVTNRVAGDKTRSAQKVADAVAEKIHHFSTQWGLVLAVGIRPIPSKQGYTIYEVECQIGQ